MKQWNARPGDVVRVRLVCNWCDSQTLSELFNRMTLTGNYEWPLPGRNGRAQRLRLVCDDDATDYWVVINGMRGDEECVLDPARTVVFHMEPEMWTERMRGQWGRWAAPSPLSFLQVRDHRRYRNACDWWLGLSCRELLGGPPPAKTKTLAACVSSKYADPGQRLRVDFLHFLDRQDLPLDIYGYEGHGFGRGRGMTPMHDKRRALLDYRYYFDAENHATPNFYTEKIVDCLLAETLCFYWGCPNLDSFFDPRAFIRLELDDFEAARAQIVSAIRRDEWSTRLPYIRAEKRRVLEDYAFFPTLARVIGARRGRSAARRRPELATVAELTWRTRAGCFLEISERTGDPWESETYDAEGLRQWSGLCLESDAVRASAARSVRDCTVVTDPGAEPVDAILRRNGISPRAIDWLNLAVKAPSLWLEQDARLDLGELHANLISMPLADEAELARCWKRLAGCGYEPGQDANLALRRGRSDLIGFYHLCTVNTWREVLPEQLSRLTTSGLADASRRVFAAVVGPEAAQGAAALSEALGARVEIIHLSIDAECGERPILEYARRFCEHEEPLARGVWYLHAKGVSAHHCDNPHIADWRRLMEHFVVDRWRECVAALQAHDACGVNWHDAPSPHFSGNFWWATPRYVATLPQTIGAEYLAPELWIGANQPHVRCWHESAVDHYLEAYPRERYAG